PPTYGLMPFACATDGDIGNVVAFTDAYTYWGFDATATLLERLQHPRATEFRREVEYYRADIMTAITYLTRPDGLIERKITAGCDEEQHTSKFDACCSFANMIVTGIPDMISEAFSRYVSYMEAHVVCDQFWGPMDREVMYMGNAEHAWQQIYLERGEWKKAFMTMRTNQRYGMTPDTFQTQERFSIYDPGFTPFQPNGSGNGRMLEMILNSLYYEGKDTVVLFGCIPFAWLRRNGITSVRNLHTPQGRIHLEATMLDRNTCRISLTGTTSDAMPATVRLPEHLHVDFHEGVTPMTAQQYAIMPDMTTITFTVSDGEAVLCQ
ncbi:MAG TPA: hypothetical protein VHV83_03930, partial [Armatimonadota bacterium]|nr:hypothetical protein [Armatimonadota bacterium]